MYKNKYPQIFLFLCLIAFIVLVFFVVLPFLKPLIIAAILAVIFYPIHLKLMSFIKGKDSLSAFLVTILAIIIVVIPISFLAKTISKEATDMYKYFSNNNVVEMAEKTVLNIGVFFPPLKNIKLDFVKYISQGLGLVINNIGSLFSSFTKVILDFFVFLIAFYFFLKDGKKLEKYFIKLSPLKDQDDVFILDRLKLAIHGTVIGNLIIKSSQGILAGFGFFMFGIPNPILWGSVAAIAAILPGIGTALVIVPAVIYLFTIGNIYQAIGLGIWGITVVGLIDNLLAPILIGRGIKLHPLAVFIAVLGGLLFFGPLGFIFGPLIISLFFTLIDIYITKIKTE